MSYLPLYPPPQTASIWSPNQSRQSISSSYMPSQQLRSDQQQVPIALQSSGKDLPSSSSSSYSASLDPRYDVFGPVMYNRSLIARPLAPSRNVGAIGDRRKKEDAEEAPDPSSVLAVGQLLRALAISPTAPADEAPLRQSYLASRVTVHESPSATSSSSSSPGVPDMLHTPSDSSPLIHRPSNALDKSRIKLANAFLEPYTGQMSARPPPEPNALKGFPSAATPFSNSIYDVSSNAFPSSTGLFHPNSFSTIDKIAFPKSFNAYQGTFNPFDNDMGSTLPRCRNDHDAFPSHWSHMPNSGSLDRHGFPAPPLYYGAGPRRTSMDSLLSQMRRSASPFESTPVTLFPSMDYQRHQPTTESTHSDHLHGFVTSPLPRTREKQQLGGPIDDRSPQPSPVYHAPHPAGPSPSSNAEKPVNEPINFLHLLSPTAVPPYSHFINRIIKSSDQQASIFLQQKLKIADVAERKKIVDAVSQRGIEMMSNRFGNWAVQRCLEPPCEFSDRMKIVDCMRGHVVELATNCYGTHVLQKALDCEEDIRLLIVSELLLGDPSSTLLNKHSAHVWSKIMELTWTPPAPPIFAVNKSVAGKWASLACHETGSLVVQTAFEQCEECDKEHIIGELLNEDAFAEVVTNAWGNFCILHLLEHGAPHHKARAIDNLIKGLSQYASHEQSIKSILKALKEGGPEVLDKVVTRLCEPPKGGRRASLVDISLSPIGSQLIGTILPSVDKEQRSALYDAIRGHVVTLRGSRVGSKVIWLFDRMRAYYGY